MGCFTNFSMWELINNPHNFPCMDISHGYVNTKTLVKLNCYAQIRSEECSNLVPKAVECSFLDSLAGGFVRYVLHASI